MKTINIFKITNFKCISPYCSSKSSNSSSKSLLFIYKIKVKCSITNIYKHPLVKKTTIKIVNASNNPTRHRIKYFHYNIFDLPQCQNTVEKCKKIVVVSYQDGFSFVANRGVVLSLHNAFIHMR